MFGYRKEGFHEELITADRKMDESRVDQEGCILIFYRKDVTFK